VQVGFLMAKDLGDIDKLKIALDSLNVMIKALKDLSYFTGGQIRTFDDLRSAYARGENLLENMKKTKSDNSEKKEKNHS